MDEWSPIRQVINKIRRRPGDGSAGLGATMGAEGRRGGAAIAVAPRRLPVLGHLVPLLRDPLGFMASLPAYGDVVSIGLGPVSAVVVCDLELTRQVLLHDRIFDKGGALYVGGRELVGDGLATCPHAKHRRQRRLLQPAFHSRRITAYAPVMVEKIAEMVDSWCDGQVVDVKTDLHTFAARVIAATLFGQAITEETQQRLLHDVEVVFAGNMRQAVLPVWLRRWPILGNRACVEAAAEARALLSELVAARRAEGVDHGDLFSALLFAHDSAGGGRLSDEEIVDQVLTFFFAGTDTSAATLAWALILLDRHPEFAARLHAEVDIVLAGRPAGPEDLPNLQFTAQVINEVLRLRPPAWLQTRTVAEDTELGNYSLRAGTTVIYSSYLIHHRADLYPDPERFDPDRFGPDLPAPPSRHAMLPFAAGARKCIGDQFALTEATLALATVAARWRLQMLPGTDVRPTLAVVPQPRQLRMHAAARIPRPARPEGTTQRV
ncbi:cytochrome P450 [Nocardia brasiliensis]|uniref:cytochrome P450 n=1 Tax=Nocardia brasiliensis TaxID=37326 RepID=UPI0002F3FE7E|nr:cytochrome P450 [Nocardia brasiliensis]